jgi:hypothetical protein
MTVPPEWPGLVAGQEPAVAVPFALGNYPQMVRHLPPLLAHDLPGLRATPARSASASLREWAARIHDCPQTLLAAAVLRMAGDLDAAAAILRQQVPGPWRDFQANELAALAWRGGDAEAALQQWQRCPERAPVRFNCGMACLFLGRPEEAQEGLRCAVAELPETSAWHHLGQLYLALAVSRPMHARER